MIGSTKTLRDGREISFTKSNPVSTFSAIRRELVKCGYELYDFNMAKTGSRYLEMYNEDLEINIRCSNHTTGYSNDGIEVSIDKNGIDGLTIDLSKIDIKISDFRNMLKQIKEINKSGCLKGLIDAYTANGTTTEVYIKEGVIPEYFIAPIDKFLKDFAKYI
ncbi:MAG: hypothetical protein HDS35_09880 [Bacteroides sp.]|nr:hypothetical protein [Bacteroides sp.]